MKKLSSDSSVWVVSRRPLQMGLLLCSSMLGLTGCLSQSLTGVTIQPSTGLTCVIPGITAQFKAYGIYTESGHATVTQDITDQVTWSSTIPAVATVNPSGIATGFGLGQTSILASTQGAFGNLTAASNIDVKTDCSATTAVRTLNSLTMIPEKQSLSAPGQTARLLAIGTYSKGPMTADLIHQVEWESSDVKVATVDATELVTVVGVGDASITARAKGPDGDIISVTETVQIPPNFEDQ